MEELTSLSLDESLISVSGFGSSGNGKRDSLIEESEEVTDEDFEGKLPVRSSYDDDGGGGDGGDAVMTLGEDHIGLFSQSGTRFFTMIR